MTAVDPSPAACHQARGAADALRLLERDRARLAQRLHDRSMQDLTTVSLQLGLLAMQAGGSAPELGAVEADLIAVLGELRTVMGSLAPAALDGDPSVAVAAGIATASPGTQLVRTGEASRVCAPCAAAYHELGLGIDPAWATIELGAVARTITIEPLAGARAADVQVLHGHAAALGLRSEVQGTSLLLHDGCEAGRSDRPAHASGSGHLS